MQAVRAVRESRWLQEIRTLDPERDCRRIVFLDAFYEFPFDTARSLELAFFKTFASPTIAALLDSTGEFNERGQKRYDDTDLLMSAFSEDGWDGDTGERALRRMNQIHGRFQIANEDFVYVMSAMVLEPLRWNERFGWRRMLETERQAQFHFWREIGKRMAIRQIPQTLAELERFNVEYEASRFRATEAGAGWRARSRTCSSPGSRSSRTGSAHGRSRRCSTSASSGRSASSARRASSDGPPTGRSGSGRSRSGRFRPAAVPASARRCAAAAIPPATASSSSARRRPPEQQRSPSPDTPPTFVLRLSYGGPVI